MSCRAHVASKYIVEFGIEINADEFENKIRTIQAHPDYEDIILWNDESLWNYELNKELLQKIVDNGNSQKIPLYLITFAKEILDSCDPDLDYVRVEFF